MKVQLKRKKNTREFQQTPSCEWGFQEWKETCHQLWWPVWCHRAFPPSSDLPGHSQAHLTEFIVPADRSTEFVMPFESPPLQNLLENDHSTLDWHNTSARDSPTQGRALSRDSSHSSCWVMAVVHRNTVTSILISLLKAESHNNLKYPSASNKQKYPKIPSCISWWNRRWLMYVIVSLECFTNRTIL